jgi:hypothetical protein
MPTATTALQLWDAQDGRCNIQFRTQKVLRNFATLQRIQFNFSRSLNEPATHIQRYPMVTRTFTQKKMDGAIFFCFLFMIPAKMSQRKGDLSPVMYVNYFCYLRDNFWGYVC